VGSRAKRNSLGEGRREAGAEGAATVPAPKWENSPWNRKPNAGRTKFSQVVLIVQTGNTNGHGWCTCAGHFRHQKAVAPIDVQQDL
jgi:hypothetical protein